MVSTPILVMVRAGRALMESGLLVLMTPLKKTVGVVGENKWGEQWPRIWMLLGVIEECKWWGSMITKAQ